MVEVHISFLTILISQRLTKEKKLRLAQYKRILLLTMGTIELCLVLWQ